MGTKKRRLRFDGKEADITAWLTWVRDTLQKQGGTFPPEDRQALRHALLSARRAPGACVLYVDETHTEAFEKLLLSGALNWNLRSQVSSSVGKHNHSDVSAEAATPATVAQQLWDTAQFHWTLRDWRVAHNAADDEGLPPRLRGAYELAVNRTGEEEITLIARTPEGHQSLVRFEADNGRLKVMAYCPEQEHPQESRDEVDVFLWLSRQGAIAESGHTDQPGMRFNGDRSTLLSPQAIAALALREPTASGRAEANAPAGSAVPQDAMSGQSSAVYQLLVDGLRNMIDGGRLSAVDIPDDYEWLVRTMANLPGGSERPPVPHGPKP